ncbi:MAG: ATP-dependent sacrificial sulfur transferase LarE [Anaerococcus sp.]|nr:ATP-dependent sacrificial sulfur transferase LarE [Anaerococcus sp.]
MEIYENKKEKLNKLVSKYLDGGAVLAFSGGVDSSLILKLASMYRKKENDIVAIIYKTETTPSGDLENAQDLAKEMKVKLYEADISVFDNEAILDNPIDRCYHCKNFLFEEAFKLKDKLGYRYVLDGSNLDDYKVFRPGLKALNDKGVVSLLKEAGFTKQMVRDYAKELGISVYKRPSSPCLATRFPYNSRINTKMLDAIDRGEFLIKNLGIKNVRIRLYGDNTRIEVERDDFPIIMENLDQITRELKELGFTYINLDLEGYRSGSMDEVLKDNDKVRLNPWLAQ